jgi:ribonuclease P protein component
MTGRRSPAVVDLPRPLPYIAASAQPRQSRWNGCREAHLPAQQARPQAPPWLPCAHGHAGRPPGAGVAPCEGPQAPVCLSFFGCTLGARAKLARPARSMTADLARLKNRADFLRVAAGRRRAVRPTFIVQAAPQPTEDASGTSVRVGFTASRKVGNAVVRNRAKRRLRAIAAEVLPQMGHPGTDYVLVARATASERPYAELLGDLEGALRQLARQTARDGSSERARTAAET